MASTYDVYALRYNYFCYGNRASTIVHYQSGVAVSAHPETDATDLAQSWYTLYFADLLAIWNPDVELSSVYARRVNNTGGPSFYGRTNFAAQGTAISPNTLDTAISSVMTRGYNSSEVGGPNKARTGRAFFGMVPDLWLVDNAWINTAITAYKALASDLSAPLTGLVTGNTYTPVIWARKTSEYTTSANPWQWVPTIGALRRRERPTP